MKDIFDQFANMMTERLYLGVPTTEDSVRYTLFSSMLDSGIDAKNVILEYPHPAIPRAKIDTWLPHYGEKPIALEIKYDRDPPSGKNQPKTQKAGYVFRDLHRLLLIAREASATAFFVYVTTEEMAVYFKNPNNGYNTFFELSPGQCLEIRKGYFSGKPTTFTNILGDEYETEVISILSRRLPANHYLRIYEIKPRIA